MSPTIRSFLIASLSFGIAGAVTATSFVWNGSGAGWRVMIPAAGTAAAVTGGIFWRWLILRRVVTWWHPILVGGFIGLVAHPVAWYLSIIMTYVTGVRSSLGGRTLNPLEGLWGCFVYSAFSILLVGWITIPVGAIVGFFLSRADHEHLSNMKPRTVVKIMIWRWILAVVLLLVFVCLAYLAMFNLWVGSGPPTPNPELYIHRGYAFGAAMLVCLISFFALCIGNLLKRKTRK